MQNLDHMVNLVRTSDTAQLPLYTPQCLHIVASTYKQHVMYREGCINTVWVVGPNIRHTYMHLEVLAQVPSRAASGA